MAKQIKHKTFILTDALRVYLKVYLDKIGIALNKIGISPNFLTLMGFVGHIIATVLVFYDQYFWSGITLAFFAIFDALDGTVARAAGKSTAWGAFIDSFTDRYSEVVLLGGMMIHYHLKQDTAGVLVAYIAITGAMLVSYARARAQALGVDIKEGLFSRVERYLVLVACLVLGAPFWGLLLLAVGTQITALQRAYTFFKLRNPKA